MNASDTDHRHMHAALALARAVRSITPPNPAVGCVIVGRDGEVIGTGATQATGGPHAEVMALRDVAARGATTQGACAYVTLEPCSHFGRTPPCADALVAAGLARVVVAITDPNPLVAGRGVERLRSTGIEVLTGVLSEEARWLNIGFFSRMQRQRPWVRLKLAASLDGRTALPDGRSQWITGAQAREDGHRFRARAGAILSGVGTVIADDPRLDVRLEGATRQPLRVIVDSHLRTPPQARLLAPPGQVLIATARDDASQAEPLRAQGAEVEWLPDAQQRVDLSALLRLLAQRGVNEVHVEAGARLAGALLAAGRVDELLVYLAPKLIGPGLNMLECPTLANLADAVPLRWLQVQHVGPDLRLRAIVAEQDRF